jgi:hypothetical protein
MVFCLFKGSNSIKYEAPLCLMFVLKEKLFNFVNHIAVCNLQHFE